ncbi:MAG: hypothetical protein Kow0063_35330 [Anaerolineae bacterium]
MIYDGNDAAEEIHNFIMYDGDHSLEQNTRVNVKGRWRFIVFMRKGVDDYTYVDGRLITPTYYRDYKTDDLLAMNHRWYIGTFSGNNPHYNNGVFNYSFYGLIDELRIYNRALSSAEIEALYRAR